MSGVGVEMCKIDELLGMMEDARNDVQEKKSTLKLARKRQDAEKERLKKSSFRGRLLGGSPMALI